MQSQSVLVLQNPDTDEIRKPACTILRTGNRRRFKITSSGMADLETMNVRKFKYSISDPNKGGPDPQEVLCNLWMKFCFLLTWTYFHTHAVLGQCIIATREGMVTAQVWWLI